MTEADFLAKLDDPAMREVYADWLEQQGDPRCELTRIANDLWKPPIDLVRARRLLARRADLDTVGDLAWRLAIVRVSADEIRRRMTVLASLGSEDEHDWELNDPLDDNELAAIEDRLGAPLPAQYRRFLHELGDGGAGPAYGIQSIADVASFSRSKPCKGLTFMISEIGCGNYYSLVLTGPDAGVVWLSGDNGFVPLRADDTWDKVKPMRATPRENRLELLDWYVRWLDEKLWDVARNTHDTEAVLDRPVEEVTDLRFEPSLAAVPTKLRRFTDLRRLSFEKAPITELPPWIGELRKLEQLVLGYSGIRALPEELCDLPMLSWVSCFHAEELATLPDGLGRLPKLRYLNLQYCSSLTSLPDSFADLRLDELLINNCRLSTLPASIGRMQIRDLNLRGNRITDLPDTLTELTELSLMENEMTSLPPVLGHLPKLEKLTLNGNRALDLPGAFRILATAPTLRSLSIGQLGLSRIPDEIGLLTQLRSLSLDYNRLVDIEALRQLPNLLGISVVCAAAETNQSSALSQYWYEMHPDRVYPDVEEEEDDEDDEDDDEDEEEVEDGDQLG